MSIQGIRDLFDQAEGRLQALEKHEDKFAELEKIPPHIKPVEEIHREDARERAAKAREETLSARVGELVRLQSKVEELCQVVE